MRNTGSISTTLLVFLCVFACALFLMRKLKVQKEVRQAVAACMDRDYSRAARLIEMLPENLGGKDLLFWRGYMHYKGIGAFAVDRENALRFWSLAAAKGHKKAIRALRNLKNGSKFEPFTGEGLNRVVSGDYDHGLEAYRAGRYTEAFDIWRPLAEKGHREAQSRLGLLYREGKGVEQDEELARFWWSCAAGTVEPHQIRDSFRTRDQWENSPEENRHSAPVSSSRQSDPTPDQSVDKAFSDEAPAVSGMGQTASISAVGSMKKQESISRTQEADGTVSDGKYKPWLYGK